MRTVFYCIASIVTFGLLVASCEAGRLNTELARAGIGHCASFDCWE